MAFSLNKVQLIGNLGQDAETRYTANNTAVTSFSIATSRSFKDKDENWKNETTWHNIVAWKLSDFYQKALVKGAKFYVEGRIQTRSYEDKDGVKKYITEIISEVLIPLTERNNSTENIISEHQNKPQTTNEDDDLPF